IEDLELRGGIWCTPCLSVLTRLGRQARTCCRVAQHFHHRGREVVRILCGNPCALACVHDVPSAHDSSGYHRDAERHRFEQDQALCFGTRCKDEHVGRAVTVQQFRGTIEITHKAHVLRELEICGKFRKRTHCGTFTADNQQNVGQCAPHIGQHVQQELDIFLERD